MAINPSMRMDGESRIAFNAGSSRSALWYTLTQVATYKNFSVRNSHFWQLNPPKCHFGVNYKAIWDDFG